MSLNVAINGARSFLFVPGNRPDRFAKAASSGADIVIIDVEDAVAEPDKAYALAEALGWLAAGNRAMVRVNAIGTSTHEAEIAALKDTDAAILLPKAESSCGLDDLRARLPRGNDVVALIETPAGIEEAVRLAAHPAVVRLALGTMDLAAHLGVDPEATQLFAYARSRLAYASAAAGLAAPIDGVTVAVRDEGALRASLAVARDFGMTAKLCIHPSQVAIVHEASIPSAAEISWARTVLRAAGSGDVALVDGKMVDRPVVNRARALLRHVDH